MWLAWTMLVAALALGVVAAPFLELRFGSSSSVFDGPISTGTVIALSFTPVGLAILRRDSGNRIGWLLCVIGFSQAVSEVSYPYADAGLGRGWPAATASAWLSDWVWSIGFGLLLTFLLLVFPTGRLPSRRWRPVAWMAATGIGLIVLAGISSLHLQAGRASVGEPLEGEGPAALLGGLGFFMVLAATPLSIAAVVARWRRAGGVERAQLKWFAYAGTITVTTLLALDIWGTGAVADVLVATTAVLIPIAIGIAILRHGLFDIDLIINRSLLYAALTLAVIGGYAAVVSAATTFLDRTGFGVSVVAAGAVAALFQPARQRLQVGVDRLTYGHRNDPYAALTQMGEAVETSPDVAQLLPTIVATIRSALRLPGVTIELDGPPQIAVSDGRHIGEPYVIELTTHAGAFGRLVVSPRSPSDQLRPDELRLLRDLARQAAVAAQAFQLNAQLVHARTELVTAAEEERRRLHRDLHDELGPTLAAVTLQIQASRNLLAASSDGVDDQLDTIGRRVQQATTEVRRIARGLRPPALDDLGLVGAISEQAAQLGGDLIIDIDADDPGPLPAAVELAAYRIVQEALTNVTRHSGATECRIGLRRHGRLDVVIDDNGCGVPASGVVVGIGLDSMKGRAAEIGGRCTITPRAEGGTRVHLSLPLNIDGAR
jgi:signal transduction histidine kinase